MREERRDFEESLKPTPVPSALPANIPFGFPIPLHDHFYAPETTPAARAAS